MSTPALALRQAFMAVGQPRDDHGKWTKGGGAVDSLKDEYDFQAWPSAIKASSTATTGKYYKAMEIPSAATALPGKIGEEQRLLAGRDRERVEVLATAMRADGWQGDPIEVEVDAAGKVWMKDGNHRAAAARMAGLKTVPTLVSFLGRSEDDFDHSSLVKLVNGESQQFMAVGQPRDDHGKWTKGAFEGWVNGTQASVKKQRDASVQILRGGSPDGPAADAARELLGAVNGSEITDAPMFRGLKLKPGEAERIASLIGADEKLELGLSSFTSSRELTPSFGTPDAGKGTVTVERRIYTRDATGNQTMRTETRVEEIDYAGSKKDSGMVGVELHTTGPRRGYDLSTVELEKNSWRPALEKEVLTAGNFKVKSHTVVAQSVSKPVGKLTTIESWKKLPDGSSVLVQESSHVTYTFDKHIFEIEQVL